jgi:hypothetical protein
VSVFSVVFRSSQSRFLGLDYVGNPLPGLLSAVGIQFDTVAEYLGTAGDRLEGHAIAGAGIERRREEIRKQDKSANPLSLG